MRQSQSFREGRGWCRWRRWKVWKLAPPHRTGRVPKQGRREEREPVVVQEQRTELTWSLAA